LHGRDALDRFRLLEKLKIKMSHHLAYIKFLKQCRDEDIILKFSTINHHLNAGKYKWIFRATSFYLVREEIKSKRKDIEAFSNKSCALHIKLTNIIRMDLWDASHAKLAIYFVKVLSMKLSKQWLKFVHLKKQQLGDSVNHNTKTSSNVINLSNQQLDPPNQRVLDYGLNFTVAPNKIPVKELICDIEAAIRPLPSDTAETIRQECAIAIRRAKLPSKNIRKEEAAALRRLRRNKNITILKADKGNATVVLNTLDYLEKVMDHLTNNGSTISQIFVHTLS
jgi:hypothetical protein